jgi:hypothetical protein
MPLPIIPNTYRSSWDFSASGGDTATNVIHFDATAGATPEDVLDVLNASKTASMWGHMSNDWLLKQISVIALDGSSGTAVAPVAFGVGSSGEFSPATSPVITLRTALRGRSHRGRIFLPPAREGVITNGYLNADTTAALQGAWSTFIAAIGAADPALELVVASYKNSSVQRVTDAIVTRKLGTQRRRQQRLPAI